MRNKFKRRTGFEHPENFPWCVTPLNMEIDPPAYRNVRLQVDRLVQGKDQYLLKLMYASDPALWEDVDIR